MRFEDLLKNSLIVFIIFIGCSDDRLIVSLTTQNHYTFEITAASSWELTRPICCKVIKNKEIVFRQRRIGSTVEDAYTLEFKLIEDERKELFGIVENTNPNVLLMLYDLRNRKSYSTLPSNSKEREYVYNLLKRLHGLGSDNSDFVFSGSLSGRDLKVH